MCAWGGNALGLHGNIGQNIKRGRFFLSGGNRLSLRRDNNCDAGDTGYPQSKGFENPYEGFMVLCGYRNLQCYLF